MRQYTTPVVQLRIDGHTVSGDVYVTFANKARNVTLTIDSPTVTTDAQGSTVEVHLTQTETGKFWYGEEVAVQVNWLASGERYATEIANVRWNENLIKEVME